jgi:hypothetical protein
LYCAEGIFEALNLQHQELMLDDLIDIWKQSILVEAEEPEPEPKERTVAILKFTRDLDLLKLASR